MAHTHEFDCKVCGAHLDSRQDLDQHTRKNHPGQQATGSNVNQSSRSDLDNPKPIS